MSSSEQELEEQLKETGNSLLNTPSATTDELLRLLDDANDLLDNVEQVPPRSMQDALLPLMKALISNELLRHSDVDVKLSVASCLTQITRITAPDAPYDDERMKEIFQLTVASFENLSHESSRYYTKAASILCIVAKVRSSLLMMDLDCDALILEMFQHFLKITKSNLPDAVFSAMETIMTMVLDESEEIPLDILKALLSSVRKENQDQTVSPISWKLGEKVIENCSAKLKSYLVEAVKSVDIALDDYAEIVASVYQNGSDALKNDNDNDSGKNLENENKLMKRTLNEASNSHVTEGLSFAEILDAYRKRGIAAPGAVNHREAGKTVAAPTRDEHNVRQKVSKQLQHCHLTKHSKCIDSRDSAQPDNSGSRKATKSEVEPYSGPKKRGRKPNSSKNSEEGHDHAQPNNSFSPKAVKSEVEPYSAPKKRGRKPNSLMNPAEGYDHSWIHSGRKTQKRRKSNDKGSDASPAEGRLHGKAALHLTLEKVTEPPGLEPKPEGDIGASSPLPQNNPLGGTQRRRGRPKKQVVADHSANRGPLFAVRREFSSTQAEERTARKTDTHLTQGFKETSTFEAKAQGHPRALEHAEKTSEECLLASIPVVTKTEAAVPFDPDEKPQQQSALDVASGSTNDQSYVRTGTKTRRGNATSGKESTEASGSKIFKSATKLSEDNEGTHKVVLKRKCTTQKEEASHMPDLDERLVGSRIKVWWPMDKAFYEGVVSSYDPAKKKHLVLYVDGDEENLNLKKQRWQLIDDVLPDFEQVQMENLPKPEASSDTPQKRKRKTKSDTSKQENAGLSSKRISRRGVSAGISIVECMKSGSKSADCSTLGELKVINGEEDDQSKENDRLKDDGRVSAGKLEAETKTGIDSAQIAPETMTSSKGESPKLDIEPSVGECAKELKELSECAGNAIHPLT
ncbi:hypothetical protein CerSpe_110760 [Prunus speciosa]